MPKIPIEVSGKLIADLCEALGLDLNDVYKIEIEPHGLIVTHTVRRNNAGKTLVGVSDVLRQRTDIKISWGK